MTVNRHLGRYELLEQLGEGGMGSVWLARLTGAAGFEKLCIVKTVLPSIAKDAEFVSRFLHEGRVLTQLSHGNIAQVLDMNEAEGQLFLALEYVAGVDLARLHEQVRAAQEFMPLPLVVALITQAAEGLGAAHRKHALDGTPLNVVHRDVSPHNIMVSYEGEVKVIDFGIAKSEARSRHTAQASVMGKLGYMAPEQARGEPVDHRADQFALAIVAWELLSNQSWVRRGTLTEMVVAMANPTVRLLAPMRPDVPASLEAVILKALSPLPEARFEDTDAFAQVLMGELLKLGPPPTKPQLGEYVRMRCSADFATTRLLLTRVSTQRSPPPEGERTQPEFAQTLVRPNPSALTAESRPAGTLPASAAMTLEHESPMTPPPVPTGAMAGVGTPTAPITSGNPTVSTRPVSNETSPARPSALEDRVSVRVNVPAVAPRAEAPLTTGELAAATPRRSPIRVMVGLVVVLAVLVAAAFAFMRPATSSVLDAGVAPVVTPPPEVVEVVAPPVVDAGEPVEEAPRPSAEPVPNLPVAGRLAGSKWIVTNQARSNWTLCRMTLPGQLVLVIGTMPRGASLELPLKRFKFDANAFPTELARVDCAQGFGLIQLPR